MSKWPCATIKEIAKVKGGKRLPAGCEFADSLTLFPYLRVTNMVNSTIKNEIVYVKPEIEPIIRNYKISKNDIYVTIAGTLGNFGTIPNSYDNAQLTENAAKITDINNAKYDKIYLVYSFNSDYVQKQIKKEIGIGGGVPKLALHRIEKLRVKYPPLPYQRKIARILTKIDNIIEKTESTIEKYKAIKQGMMHDLFTRGVDVKTGKLRTSYEDAPELYKETALGMIPKGWDIGVLNDYCMSFINGGTPSTKNSAYWQGNIPWITGADFLETFEIGLIRRKITYEAVKNSATHVIPKGNILLVTRTGVGKLAIAPTDIAISQDITGLILDSEITIVDYFYYYFQRLVEDFKKMNQGTSINGIIRDDLMNCPIHVPKTTEQTMVAAKLLRIDNRLKNEQQYLDKHKKLKQGLMQDLLTGKKEVTPDPEDFETMNNEYE